MHAGVAIHELIAIPADREARLVPIMRTLRAARKVVLITHVNSDADGIGSQAAITAWLESIGIEVAVINPSPVPPHLSFLLPRHDITLDLGDPRAEEWIREADLAVVLDTSEANRIAPLDRRLHDLPVIVIDHHPPGPTVLGDGIQDTRAAATGELVYDLITLAGDGWPPAAVIGVYVALVSDTGSFRFSNTSPRAHAIAAEMLARGVDPEALFQKLFAVTPLRRIELLREALAHLHHDPEGGITWMLVPREITERLGSTPEDYEGLIEHARSIEGTHVALLFRETGPQETKLSLRSSGATNVNRVARQFGGGGHVKASGATVSLGLEEAVRQVLAAVREEIAQSA